VAPAGAVAGGVAFVLAPFAIAACRSPRQVSDPCSGRRGPAESADREAPGTRVWIGLGPLAAVRTVPPIATVSGTIARRGEGLSRATVGAADPVDLLDSGDLD
jgi:hypothetical protein